MHSDPIADMLTRIRNGCRARMQRVQIPYSRLKEFIADVLKREGYITNFRTVGAESGPKCRLEVELKYDEKRESVISGIQRLSSPGLRRYYKSNKCPKVRKGLGIIILTTSRGLMTDHEARKSQVGGEALCAVW